MKPPELVSALRDLIDDNAAPQLWTSAELLRYLNDAERQACRRAYILEDHNTASICALSLAASTMSFALHSLVLKVLRVFISSANVVLRQTPRDFLDAEYGQWWSTYGVPGYYVHEANDELLLNTMLYSADSASLLVARLPLQDFSTGSTETIETKAMYHDDLLLWGAHKAFLKNDSDTLNLQLADYYEKQFTARFGPLPDTATELKRKRLPIHRAARSKEFGYS